MDLEVEEQEDLVGSASIWDWLPALLTFLVIYIVLLIFFEPSALFSQTHATGGDTGAHHYPAQYLIQELLPHFKLTGWAPGWFAGMPMFTFYWPFPFLLIAIFNWFLPYTVAFKIVTVLGIFALPACAYGLGHLWRVRRPFAVIAAVFALPMLFNQSYTIYGGNVASTMAGEFCYMLSFSLAFLFLGTLHRGMEKPRLNMLFVLNCLLLMAIVLSHILTTIVLVAMVPGLFLVHPRWRSLAYVAGVAVVALCLTAFWWLPFAVDLKWTSTMTWQALHSLKQLFPAAILPVTGLGLVGMAYAVARKERRLLPLGWITFITLVMFWSLPSSMLWNARVMPFLYMSLHLWAAYGVTWFIRPFAVSMGDLFSLRESTAKRMYTPVVAVIIGAIIISMGVLPGKLGNLRSNWILWNYKGYEAKAAWPQYKSILDFLDTLTPGRVMVEHAQQINDFGTSRAFELIPYWTDLDTMNGTLMEASYTSGFYFVNESELSEEAAPQVSGIDYPGIDTERGITHLQLMNIPYLITVVNKGRTEEVTPGVQADKRAEELAVFGDYHIFRIAGTTGYVQVAKNQPVKLAVPQKDWRGLAAKWYLTESALDTPIIWDNGSEALKQFASITPNQVTDPPADPIETEGHVTSETFNNESLSFDTTAIGQPHWIKISYFPNWHVKGAEGPFLASPSFMMVIPTQSHVELYYGRTPANTIGQILEIVGWLVLAALVVWRTILSVRRRRLRQAIDDEPLWREPDERDDV